LERSNDWARLTYNTMTRINRGAIVDTWMTRISSQFKETHIT